MDTRQRAAAVARVTTEDVEIPRATLLSRAIACGKEGDVIGAVWFATMVGEPRYDEFPLRLPADLARDLGLLT